MTDPDWEIPLNLQPEPGEYSYDLEGTLRAVVSLRASVPADAFTAESLGTERTGSGVVIKVPGAPEGLVLTIGYLVTEAESVWLVSYDGRVRIGCSQCDIKERAAPFALVFCRLVQNVVDGRLWIDPHHMHRMPQRIMQQAPGRL